MDAKANPHGILETLETSEDEIPKSGEAGNQPRQCRDTGKFAERILANSRESDSEYCVIQRKIGEKRFSIFLFLLQICNSVN